jgi:hypothetical protein
LFSNSTALNAHFSFDGKPITYLLHGQEFTIDILAQSCWFLIIRYQSNQGSKWKILRPKSRFTSIANAYEPEITIWGIGWGIKTLLYKKLNINFLNTIEQKVCIKKLPIRLKPGSPRKSVQLTIKKIIPFLQHRASRFMIPDASKIKTNLKFQINPKNL